MLKKCRQILFICALFIICAIPVNAAENTSKDVTVLTEFRTNEEVRSLENTYESLFPNEYHYIVEYQNNGVIDMDQDDIDMIFYGSKEVMNVTYELIVMNNGQVFTNQMEIIPEISLNALYATTTANFTVGDLGHYNTFNVTYQLYNPEYDRIKSCNSITGSGFYLYPTNISKKWVEDADGPAHYGYNNVSMNYDGSGVLYDIGVAVGKNQAHGISKIASGADAWLWYLLYAFFG